MSHALGVELTAVLETALGVEHDHAPMVELAIHRGPRYTHGPTGWRSPKRFYQGSALKEEQDKLCEVSERTGELLTGRYLRYLTSPGGRSGVHSHFLRSQPSGPLS